MEHKQNLGRGFKAIFNPLTSYIIVYNKGNQQLSIASPKELIRDAGVFYRTKRPSFTQWINTLFEDTGYEQKRLLPSQGRLMCKFRYHVKIGCTEFTYSQLDKLIKFAVKCNDI